jgi:hypothetical protein
MCDVFYIDTERALSDVDDLDLDVLSHKYRDKINALVVETGYLLIEYERLMGERGELVDKP